MTSVAFLSPRSYAQTGLSCAQAQHHPSDPGEI
jgi:hypothetical protein